MKKIAFYIVSILILFACEDKKNTDESLDLTTSNWLGKLEINQDNAVHFNFSINKENVDSSFITIYNGEEELVQPLKVKEDSLFFSFPVFDRWFKLKQDNDSTISGKMFIPSKKYEMNFSAAINNAINDRQYSQHDNNAVFNGKWKVSFNDGGNYSDAIGVFNINADNATGTFLTETGDYRYLQGSTKEDSLFLSCFDGSHVFLFTAKVHDNDSISGNFYSGNHYLDTWQGVRNDQFELRRADTITKYVGDSMKLSFEFLDVNGIPFSFPNPMFSANKITLIQIMGTWCPNCKDEVVYYQELMQKYDDITVVALCAEYPETFEGKAERVKALQEKYNIEYPLLIAGNVDKKETSENMPFLNHVVSYPTTVIVDKSGKVRRVHTGFYGPGTGEYYDAYKTEMENFLESLR